MEANQESIALPEELQKGQFIPWMEVSMEDQIMDWQDANLETAMREIIGITDGDIMHNDVWEIRVLILNDKNIENVSALGELVNLTSLTFGWN